MKQLNKFVSGKKQTTFHPARGNQTNKPGFMDYLWGTFFCIFIGAALGFIFAIKNGGF